MVEPYVDNDLIDQIVQRVVSRMREPSAEVKPSAGSEDGRRLTPVNVSVRHLHLCREHLDVLYGKGFELEPRNKLYQPGEFAANQTVTLVGPRMRCLGDVRILGPLRKATQVEVSRTDAIYLGIDPPVRPSGNHEGSERLILVGPVGVVHLERGVILANRHIHLSTESAEKWGLHDNQIVKVRIKTAKKTVFEDVQVRVNKAFLNDMHLDTDDGNAAGLRGGEQAEIID